MHGGGFVSRRYYTGCPALAGLFQPKAPSSGDMISDPSLKDAMPWRCPAPSPADGTRGRYERLKLCAHDDICTKLITPSTVLGRRLKMRAPVLPWGATGSGKNRSVGQSAGIPSDDCDPW